MISVFDTFPWPQKPKRGEIAEVAAAAVVLRTAFITEDGIKISEP